MGTHFSRNGYSVVSLVARLLQDSLCCLPRLAINHPQTPNVERKIQRDQLDSRELRNGQQRISLLHKKLMPEHSGMGGNNSQLKGISEGMADENRTQEVSRKEAAKET